MVRRLIDLCLPDLEGAEIETDGVTLRSAGIVRRLTFSAHKHDRARLTWYVRNADDKYGTFPKGLGGIGVLTEPTDEGAQERLRAGYRWPTAKGAVPAELSQDVRVAALPALDFVRDRADLGALLLRDDTVRRRPAFVQFRMANSPARLVQAVILARESSPRWST